MSTNGKIIVAVIDGELLVRRLQKNFNTAILTASNNKVADIPLTAFSERNLVWGVVTCVIHIYENSLFINTKKNNVKAKDSNNSKRIIISFYWSRRQNYYDAFVVSLTCTALLDSALL
jgi:DNA polymerase V